MNNRSQTIYSSAFLGILNTSDSFHMTVSDENLDKIYYG